MHAAHKTNTKLTNNQSKISSFISIQIFIYPFVQLFICSVIHFFNYSLLIHLKQTYTYTSLYKYKCIFSFRCNESLAAFRRHLFDGFREMLGMSFIKSKHMSKISKFHINKLKMRISAQNPKA